MVFIYSNERHFVCFQHAKCQTSMLYTHSKKKGVAVSDKCFIQEMAAKCNRSRDQLWTILKTKKIQFIDEKLLNWISVNNFIIWLFHISFCLEMCEDDRRYIVGFKKEDWSYETDFLGIILNYSLYQKGNNSSFEIASKCGSRGGGTGGPDPPGKSQVIWVSIGNKQLDPPPLPWKMLDPLWNLEKWQFSVKLTIWLL